MMNRYIGKTCPYCKSVFVENDDIVVCSDCDMPHHKECWIFNKGCTTFGCTGTIQGIDFGNDTGISDAPKYEMRMEDENIPSFCTKCGAPLSLGSQFCGKCGTSVSVMMGNATQNSQGGAQISQKISAGIASLMGDFSTGNNMDSEMGEYIGTKKEYYISTFVKLKSQNNYISWNWFSFLVAPYWLLYRKMYVAGAAVLGVNFIFSLIGGFLGNFLSLLVYVLCGVFGNYFYMYNLEQRIAAGKNKFGNDKTEYLQKYGGVTLTIPIVTAVIYVLICTIVFFG